MMKLLRNLKVNNSGASAAEYALIIALVAGAIVVGATALGTNINGAFNSMADKVATNTTK